MKKLALLIAVVFARNATAITLDDLTATNNLSAPPTNYVFRPWSSCSGPLGAYGVFSNATLFGANEAGVWPVGPYAFVSALHINDFRGPYASNKWEKIKYLGTTNHIAATYIIADDLVLYTVTNQLPQWHTIWRGPYVQDYVTYFPPPLNFSLTNSNGRLRLTNHLFMAVLPGPLGTSACSNAISWTTPGWGLATNTVFAGYDTISYIEPRIDAFQTAWSQYGTYGTQLGIYGGSVNVKFAVPGTTGIAKNFGSRTGDSGGALFIRDGNTPTSPWKLVGLANSGGFCSESQVNFSVIDQSIGWRSDFWNILGQSTNYAAYTTLKSTFFTDTAYYTNCLALITNTVASVSVTAVTNTVTSPTPPAAVVTTNSAPPLVTGTELTSIEAYNKPATRMSVNNTVPFRSAIYVIRSSIRATPTIFSGTATIDSSTLYTNGMEATLTLPRYNQAVKVAISNSIFTIRMVQGDVDGDGYVTPADLALIGATNSIRADINLDGYKNNSDRRIIGRFLDWP